MTTGRIYITIEGGQGVGKSTLAMEILELVKLRSFPKDVTLQDDENRRKKTSGDIQIFVKQTA